MDVNPTCGCDRRSGPSQRGTTIIELTMSATILVALTYIVTTLSISGSAAQKFAARLNRTTEIAQDVSDAMRRDLTSSVRLFHDDAAGNGYLSLLDFSGAKPGIGYRLPRLDVGGVFGPESGTGRRTGNALMLARPAWRTRYTAASGQPYRVDVYRIVHFYPAVEGTGPTPGKAIGLNLVRWVSEPLADGDQIDNIASSLDRDEVCRHLLLRTPDDDGVVHPAVAVAWRRNAPPAVTGTLRHIQPSGELIDDPQPPRASIWRVLRDEGLSSNNLLYYRHHSIATNFAPTSYGVGKFSRVEAARGGFPHGFEVQVIGPASARQVLLRLVVASTNRRGHPAHSAIQTIADVRDL